jgi:hypothetical protein
MQSLDEYIAIEVNGESVGLRQVLRFAKWGRESGLSGMPLTPC